MSESSKAGGVKLFVCGDVMTGRGIDQVLPHPSNPVLYESYVRDARGYVELAEEMNGPIPKPVDFYYIWGDALSELEKRAPDVRIINLETSVTTSEDYWKDKGINYRMHPGNIPCLHVARIDICTLANNHVLDWGYHGLLETIDALTGAGIRTAGAGRNIEEARAPAIKDLGQGRKRALVFAFGHPSAGVTRDWAASADGPGVWVAESLSKRTVQSIGDRVREAKHPGDIVVASVHWGLNWGYEIPRAYSRFAHDLIDEAGVDVVHGHSSHHVKGIEVYRNKLILYGCGDLLNDYEGIGGYEQFGKELGALYFPCIDPLTGDLLDLRLVVMRTKRFRLEKATKDDALCIADILNREGKVLGTRVTVEEDNTLIVQPR